MSQSLLLKVARQSITEVLTASREINVLELKQKYPVLNEKMATAVTLFVDGEVRSHYCSLYPEQSLIDDFIQSAKIAAFEMDNYPPITTSQYLHVSVEVSILTPLKELSYNSFDELESYIQPYKDGIIMSCDKGEAYLFPNAWSEVKTSAIAIEKLADILDIRKNLEQKPKIEIFQVQSAKDRAILQI